MDLITLILIAIAFLIAVISLFLSHKASDRHRNPPGPENEKKDPDPPEEPWRDSLFKPTDFYCGD